MRLTLLNLTLFLTLTASFNAAAQSLPDASNFGSGPVSRDLIIKGGPQSRADRFIFDKGEQVKVTIMNVGGTATQAGQVMIAIDEAVMFVRPELVRRNGDELRILGRDLVPPQDFDIKGRASSQALGETFSDKTEENCEFRPEEVKSGWSSRFYCYGKEVSRHDRCPGKRIFEASGEVHRNQAALDFVQDGEVIASIETAPVRTAKRRSLDVGHCLPTPQPFDPSRPFGSSGSAAGATR